MQKQEFMGVKLTLRSEEGIKPLIDYFGRGRLTKDSDGFLFTERPTHKRIRNVRVAKLCEGTFIMYEVKTGRYKLQVMLNGDEMSLKAINDKVRPMLKEAKEGGMI